MPQQKSEKDKLSPGTVILMLPTAFMFDIVQAILAFFGVGLIINSIFSCGVTMVFFMWFWMHGVSFSSPKNLLTMSSGVGVELIPVLNILPGWFGAVLLTIIFTKSTVLNVASKLLKGDIVGAVKDITVGDDVLTPEAHSMKPQSDETSKNRNNEPVSVVKGNFVGGPTPSTESAARNLQYQARRHEKVSSSYMKTGAGEAQTLQKAA